MPIGILIMGMNNQLGFFKNFLKECIDNARKTNKSDHYTKVIVEVW